MERVVLFEEAPKKTIASPCDTFWGVTPNRSSLLTGNILVFHRTQWEPACMQIGVIVIFCRRHMQRCIKACMQAFLQWMSDWANHCYAMSSHYERPWLYKKTQVQHGSEQSTSCWSDLVPREWILRDLCVGMWVRVHNGHWPRRLGAQDLIQGPSARCRDWVFFGVFLLWHIKIHVP